jgi:hypothetical protein
VKGRGRQRQAEALPVALNNHKELLNMNKKNISLVCAGILLLSLQLMVNIGGIYVDVFNDILAFVLIAVGGFPLAKRNNVFQKSARMIVMGLILTIGAQLLSIYAGVLELGNIVTIMCGLSVIVNIYYTYYFNEGLMLEAKFQEKEALTRSLRLIWALYGILVFLSFIATMAGIRVITIAANALSLIYCIFYVSNIMSIAKQLYMEGLPTKHMS